MLATSSSTPSLLPRPTSLHPPNPPLHPQSPSHTPSHTPQPHHTMHQTTNIPLDRINSQSADDEPQQEIMIRRGIVAEKLAALQSFQHQQQHAALTSQRMVDLQKCSKSVSVTERAREWACGRVGWRAEDVDEFLVVSSLFCMKDFRGKVWVSLGKWAGCVGHCHSVKTKPFRFCLWLR